MHNPPKKGRAGDRRFSAHLRRNAPAHHMQEGKSHHPYLRQLTCMAFTTHSSPRRDSSQTPTFCGVKLVMTVLALHLQRAPLSDLSEFPFSPAVLRRVLSFEGRGGRWCHGPCSEKSPRITAPRASSGRAQTKRVAYCTPSKPRTLYFSKPLAGRR